MGRHKGPVKVPLYSYVSPINRAWVLSQGKKKKVPYSRLVDELLAAARIKSKQQAKRAAA